MLGFQYERDVAVLFTAQVLALVSKFTLHYSLKLLEGQADSPAYPSEHDEQRLCAQLQGTLSYAKKPLSRNRMESSIDRNGVATLEEKYRQGKSGVQVALEERRDDDLEEEMTEDHSDFDEVGSMHFNLTRLHSITRKHS